tara:strand:+ start:1314 stop:1757 length:444 start_codon:yes stop_codon:yes gene_type:complete
LRTITKCLNVKSTRAPEFVDITELVGAAVGESEVDSGIAVVFSRHTTAAIKINENEPLLIKDMEHFLSTLAPQDSYYGHNDFTIRTVHMHEDECPNGHAHCQHLTLGNSEMIPIVDGELALGNWQRVFLVELDIPKNREVLVQVMGE